MTDSCRAEEIAELREELRQLREENAALVQLRLDVEKLKNYVKMLDARTRPPVCKAVGDTTQYHVPPFQSSDPKNVRCLPVVRGNYPEKSGQSPE
jgi:hypothetical protein